MPTQQYAVRFTNDAGQPISDAGVVAFAELLTGAHVDQSSLDASGFTHPLDLRTGVPYRVTTHSVAIPTAIVLPGRDDIITVNPANAETATQAFGQAQPYRLVVPFELLAQFIITPSGTWMGTISGGGLTGEWLSEPGTSWRSDGTLVTPVDPTVLKDARYWHVDVSAVAAIALTQTGVPVALQAFSPIAVEFAYDLGGTIATATTASEPLTVATRGVFVLDASAEDSEIGFRFLAPSDPGLSATSIRGELTITPYALQTGQAK